VLVERATDIPWARFAPRTGPGRRVDDREGWGT